MKPIIQLAKMLLLCMAVLFAKDSAAQTFPIQFFTQQGQCVDLGIDTLGVNITTFTALSGPFNGTLNPGIRPGSWVYCPDTAFTGTDQAFVYYCINGTACDSTTLYFTVQGNSCNLTVSVSPNSSPCMGPLPGAAATGAGGTPPYTYEWNNNLTGTFNCNLAPGTYCVTATDATGCTATSCTTISGCQVTVSVVTDSFGCLIATATGGSGGYTYFWSDSSTGSSICNPTPGLNYCVTVIDAQSCAGSECGQVNCNLFGAISGTPTCLVVTTAGGSGDYSYAWSNGSAQGPTMCPGGAGNYCVTITDNISGCTEILCDTIMGCTFTSTVTQSGNCIVVAATGGSFPYYYVWNSGDTASTICPSMPGTYCVTVVDNQGCTDLQCITYNGGCLPVSIVLDSSGCMQPVVTAGTPPFTYNWSDGSTGSVNCSFLSGITYSVTVTDVQGCSGTATFFNPCQLSVVVTFDSLNNCYTAIATGGNGGYTYMWSNNSITATICPGTPPQTNYCVTVSDANGCLGFACSSQNGSCGFTNSFQSTPASIIGVFSATYDQSLQPVSIVWDFADGTVETGFTITRLFNSCGFISGVSMTLLDSLSQPLCSSQQFIYIPCDTFYNYCQASFTFYQDSTDNKKFQFADRSVYNPISYQWNFGDGNLSTAANPVHTYANPGIYNVCLVVIDASGCSSTFCQNVNAGNVQIQDLAAYIYHYTTITPGFGVWVNLSYCNYGTTLMDGTVEYRYPAGTTLNYATPAPIAHDPAQRLLTFSFDDLYPNTCRTIAVDLTASTSLTLGSAVHDTVWVKPLAGDINVANNSASTYNIVIGSWDPNDKAVSPSGVGDDGEIPENTEVLTYKIRFQNTGTASAVNVVIRDMIDSNIDLTSLTVPDASHEHITELIGNELVVTFNNIMLPDSNANEPESHGYIQVIAHLKPGLTRGTQIFNTAEIYFDFNEPVITNTVVNTLKDQEIGIGKIPAFNFGVMPNPAEDVITLTGKFSRNAVYEIMNELGQVLLSDDVTSDKMQINIKDLHAGIYFIRVKSNDKVGVQRLFVTE